MEINKFDKEITGVVPTADIVEGRMGLLTTHGFSWDWGSRADLPGFKVPATAEEAKRARYIITWSVDNRQYPRLEGLPRYDWALRGPWDQSQTFPNSSVTLYVSNPGNQEGLTIPSGTPALAFGKGVYTIPSGAYINNSNLRAGANVIVANTAEDTSDAGKIKYQASFDDRVVGVVREYDSSTGKLTIEINY